MWFLSLGVPGSRCQLELASADQLCLKPSLNSCHPFPSPSPSQKSPTKNSDCLVLPVIRAKVLRPTLFLSSDLKTHLDWAKYSFSSSFETVEFYSYAPVSPVHPVLALILQHQWIPFLWAERCRTLVSSCWALMRHSLGVCLPKGCGFHTFPLEFLAGIKLIISCNYQEWHVMHLACCRSIMQK